MKVRTIAVIELSEEECAGLRTLLGKQSSASYKDLGVEEDVAAKLSTLYSLLPHTED